MAGGSIAQRQPPAPAVSKGGSMADLPSAAPREVLSPQDGARPLPAAADPSASDVLAETASVSPLASGTPSDTGTRWEGSPRKLIRRRVPEFPTVLSALGQEVEGEARITVAPSGIVTRVEITRSSGYIEVDASVAAALRDYLYFRVDGTDDSIGAVPFRFRLEKQD